MYARTNAHCCLLNRPLQTTFNPLSLLMRSVACVVSNLNDDVKLTQKSETSPEDDEIEVVEVLHVVHYARIA